MTDADGRVIYANTHLTLAGAAEGTVVRPVERLFTGASDVRGDLPAGAGGARPPRACRGRAHGARLDGQAAAWYQIRVRPVRRNGRDESIWTVADITADRKSEEGAVQELQNAVNFLDHAPAGFFSAEPSGPHRLHERHALGLAGA